MEAELPSPQISPESRPNNVESIPGPAMPQIERAPEPSGGETREVASNPSQAGPAPVMPPPQPPMIQPATAATPTTAADSSTTANPVVAADDDLIEKEWVDRAKKIVASTKNDPHQQELEVSKLQADYLKKRWNRDVKLVSE